MLKEPKRVWVAYLLLGLFGGLGLHRFYLGRPKSGAVMLVLFLMGMVPTLFPNWLPRHPLSLFEWAFVVGFFVTLGVFVWMVIDWFKIPKMVAACNSEAAE